MPENHSIAFVNSNKTWGGGEKWHLDIAEKLQEKGYNVFFIVHKNSELLNKVREAGISYIPMLINNFSFINPIRLYKLSKIFSRKHATSVILNLPSDMKTAGPAAKRAGLKNIIYRRGTALPVHNNFFNHYLFRKVITHIIANSYETKNLLVKNNPRLVDSDKVQVIYNGIDFNKFDNQPVNPLYTKSGNELVLGNASRFVEQKGHKYLIEIAQKLKKNNIPFRLLLAGEGHLKNSIIKMAKKEGVYQNIIFTGFISDIKSFMASVDIFLLTSLWEGFGYVIVEAMADKKPVLAFNISSNPEIIEDGKNGFLIPYSDTGIFTERIVTLYRNPGLIEQMGRQARISVRENFDIEKTSKKIEKLIRESQ